MKREQLKSKIQEMNESLIEEKDKFLEKIILVILRCINGFMDWEDGKKEILNIFIDSLTKTYSLTSKEVKKIYSKTKEFNIKDILSLTYQADGKTIEQRINQHIQKAIEMLENNHSGREVIIFLSDKLDKLLENETAIIRNAVIQQKVAPVASILVIEGQESDCRYGCSEYIGEYPADEGIPLPPYHPSCSCTYYYIETEDLDDIRDLDLEDENPETGRVKP